MTVDQAISMAQKYARLFVDLALLLIFVVTIVQHFGFSVPMVRSMGSTELLYTTAAWAFLSGRIKLG